MHRRINKLLAAALLVCATHGTLNAQEAGTALGVRQDDRLGHLLTDASGRTLYTHAEEQGCRSLCVGACERQWLPVLLEPGSHASPAGIAGRFDTSLRGDGTSQACYNGRPLYRSAGDAAPGDVRGHGQGGKWYVANIEPVVQVLTDAAGRPYLAGPDGMTLYSIVSDRPGIGKCLEGCAENWPPLLTGHRPVAPAGLEGKLGALRRTPPDHRLQVTYRGRPLYYWSRDRAVGDLLGEGIGDIWSVARPGPAGP